MNMRIIAGVAITLAFGAVALDPAVGSAQPGTRIATWDVQARGAGGRVAGSLFSDGTATGNGELAHMIPGGAATAHIEAVSWSLLSANTYGIIVRLTGDVGGTRCIVLSASDGAPQLGAAIADDGICAHAEPQSDVAGKVNLLP